MTPCSLVKAVQKNLLPETSETSSNLKMKAADSVRLKISQGIYSERYS
jgi:hypothetical protein